MEITRQMKEDVNEISKDIRQINKNIKRIADILVDNIESKRGTEICDKTIAEELAAEKEIKPNTDIKGVASLNDVDKTIEKVFGI